jgi:ABC-type multidrug transport system ATPase subunit
MSEENAGMSGPSSIGRIAATEPALLTEGLTRKYDEFVALSPVSLRVELGEFVALVGPNGAGKTTLLTMLTGLLEPSGGIARIAGHPAGSLAARAAVSYLPDIPVLYDDLSLDEHLEYVARLHGVEQWEGRARELLDRLGLGSWGGGLPSEFSRGMRQKAAIALALVRPFSLLIADEPYDGLDPPSRRMLFDLFDESRRDGAAVMVSTHRREVIEAADRCLALSEGSVVYDGDADPSRIPD